MGLIREPNGKGTMHPLAAAVAGAGARALVHPISNLKVYMQAGGPGSLLGASRTAYYKTRFYGFNGLCTRAFVPAVARAFPHYGIKVGLFNGLCDKAGLRNPPGVAWPPPLSLLQCAVAGAAANAGATIFTHPLDVLKVRTIINPPGEKAFYSGEAGAWSHMMKEGPFKGLYRGLSISLVGASVFGAASFTGWWIFERIPHRRGGRNGAFVSELLEGPIFAFAIASVACSAAYPLDVIRRQYMAQSLSLPKQGNIPISFSGLVDCVRQIYLRNNIWGFWAGNIANSMKVAPQLGAFWILLRFLNAAESPVGAANVAQ